MIKYLQPAKIYIYNIYDNIQLSKFTNLQIDDELNYTVQCFNLHIKGPGVSEHTQAINLKLSKPLFKELKIAP